MCKKQDNSIQNVSKVVQASQKSKQVEADKTGLLKKLICVETSQNFTTKNFKTG